MIVFAGNHIKEQSVIHIHYLGHAAFVLRFDNGLTALLDYGKSHSYELQSPVYGLGGMTPDILTYSHQHEDHAGGEVPAGVSHILTGQDGLEIRGLAIVPILTFEISLEKPDNTSYLFIYKGLRVLHLGDVQALISHFSREEIRQLVIKMYPDEYDLVMLPIGSVKDILRPAADFLDILKAKRIIPMHYWSPGDKQRFLDLLEDRKGADGRPYLIQRFQGPDLFLQASSSEGESTLIISLEPGPVRNQATD